MHPSRDSNEALTGGAAALTILKAGEGWALCQGRMVRLLEERRRDLEKPQGEETSSILRGEIKAIREFMSLPDDLLREIRQKRERQYPIGD